LSPWSFPYREGKRRSLVVNLVGTLVVAFVLMMNLARATPLAALVATLLIALGLYRPWVKNGRGITGVEAEE
jgi:hypothetical protein